MQFVAIRFNKKHEPCDIMRLIEKIKNNVITYSLFSNMDELLQKHGITGTNHNTLFSFFSL